MGLWGIERYRLEQGMLGEAEPVHDGGQHIETTVLAYSSKYCFDRSCNHSVRDSSRATVGVHAGIKTTCPTGLGKIGVTEHAISDV